MNGLNHLLGATGLDKLSHETVGSFRTPRGNAELRRSRIDGSHEVVFPRRREFLRLPHMEEASPVEVMTSGRETVLIMRGREADCAVSYRMIVIGRSDSGNTRIGNCRSDFRFSEQRGTILATELGAADPEYWQYSKREIVGPILQSALKSPAQQRPAASSSTRTASRPTTARPASSRQATASRPSAPAPATQTVASAPAPKRLESVGYEVVPEAVEVTERSSRPSVKLD